MTPDEVVKKLDDFKQAPAHFALLVGNEWTDWKAEIIPALSSAISIIQDYQKLREKINVEKIAIALYQADYVPCKWKDSASSDDKWLYRNTGKAIVTYLQQPTEHIGR